MASFVPIQDIDGYISGLKREGFYNDLQIEDIRRRHQDALDAMNEQKERKKRERTLRLERSVLEKISKIIKTPFDLQIDNVWECSVKIKVRKDGTLKVDTVFPFAEFDHWMTYKSEHKPPMMMMVKCLKLAGAPRSACEEFVNVW
jgi:hypothetical protein